MWIFCAECYTYRNNLNRLYDQGAKICLETMYAPAFLIGQLQTLHINMPIIVLGGAALYDIRENMYLEVQAMPYEDADYLYQMVQLLGYCGVMFTLRGNSMMLFHVGEKSRQERLLSYEKQEEGELLKPVRIRPMSARYDAEKNKNLL